MATTPAFANTVNTGGVSVSATASGSYTAPTNTVTIFTAGASGSKIEEITCVATGNTVAGLINIYVKDGSNYWLIDQYTVTAITMSLSATAPGYYNTKRYPNLVLNANDTLVATSTVASQLVLVTAFGGSF